MRNMEAKRVVAALAALAQQHRLAVFRLLIEHAPDGLPAGVIAERLEVAPPTLSFHLKELFNAGLVTSQQEGRFIWYRADLDAMNGLVCYLTENCCKSSAVCDAKCAPKQRPIAEPIAPRPKRRRSAS